MRPFGGALTMPITKKQIISWMTPLIDHAEPPGQVIQALTDELRAYGYVVLGGAEQSAVRHLNWIEGLS
ncbi:MAG: hypothetical protein M1600_01430 [Firmicutes bacterium]|nr:hypothetical protein [Bacillota bacterium]